MTFFAIESGKGFDRSSLSNMRGVYLAFPNLDALRQELSWTHYRLLSRVNHAQARAFYTEEAIRARWSTRELERQIGSFLFERLAKSRDEAGVLSLPKPQPVPSITPERCKNQKFAVSAP